MTVDGWPLAVDGRWWMDEKYVKLVLERTIKIF
jgi:hypothetical protein